MPTTRQHSASSLDTTSKMTSKVAKPTAKKSPAADLDLRRALSTPNANLDAVPSSDTDPSASQGSTVSSKDFSSADPSSAVKSVPALVVNPPANAAPKSVVKPLGGANIATSSQSPTVSGPAVADDSARDVPMDEPAGSQKKKKDPKEPKEVSISFYLLL